ncbi:MAG: hypothetical protein R3B57_05685 [Phycisphaerales bacterium]
MARRAIGMLRRLALAGASLATLWVGMTLVWALVRPGVVEQVGTMSLVGVVGLLLAPVLTLAAVRLDARVARREFAAERSAIEHDREARVVAHVAARGRLAPQRRRARALVRVGSSTAG